MDDFDAPIFDRRCLQADELSDSDPDESARDQDLGRFFGEIKKLDPYFDAVGEAIKRLKTSSDHILKGFMDDNGAEKASADARTEGTAALNALSNRLKALNEQVGAEKAREDS